MKNNYEEFSVSFRRITGTVSSMCLPLSDNTVCFLKKICRFERVRQRVTRASARQHLLLWLRTITYELALPIFAGKRDHAQISVRCIYCASDLSNCRTKHNIMSVHAFYCLHQMT